MGNTYKVRAFIVVTGKDKMAEGMLEIKLPYPPQVGLEIADLCTLDPLMIESVSWSLQASKFAVWLTEFCDHTRKLSSLLGRFVGEWEWDISEIPEEINEEALEQEIQDQQEETVITDEARQSIRDKLKARGNTLPRNPRDDVPKPTPNPEDTQ